MFETKSGIFLIAGLGMFALAFLSNGLVPWLMYTNLPEKTVEELIVEQANDPERARSVLTEFRDLHDRYPEAFARYYGEPTVESCAVALREGRRVYVAEGCWHCHSQFVRPVSNEEPRWGPVARSWEFQNELQKPVLFGTRRVGPDLSREGGRHSNDWHVVHFFQPRWTSPDSVMPEYPWFFDGSTHEGPGAPNRRGIAIITYMQWLGSWLKQYPHYHQTEALWPRGIQ
ncbi:MAG: cbb3-type cytochrome c oxidase subunit II [Gemmataceae bacterium]|nr:cbb3-type cytochrome c oxidase subunit II [Gemmataceae bacterium]MDW8267016.1 cbb3-type cytochrome c oxidase subunit II [Gemmataceae bacterium]